jgi:TonB family protein
MSARNARILLISAFALSLLLHFLFALTLHKRGSEKPTDVEVVRLEHRSMVLHVTKTPPPPPPHPKHTPAPVNSPAPKRSAAATKPAGPGGSGTPPPPPPATSTPAPVAVTNPCGRNDAEAALVSEPTPPVIPVTARSDGTSGTTVVKVELDLKGTVTGTSVAQTSGSQTLDLIAVQMARDAEYSPALHDCKPVATAYEFSVRFAAW